jgi:uncharacterized membrane protein
MIVTHVRRLVVTVWVGSLLTIGYIVAPTLFAMLPDSILAGTIAGRLFRIEAWIGVASAIILLGIARFAPDGQDGKFSRRATLLVSCMLGCMLIGYFALQPFMAGLREAAAASGGMTGDTKARFGLLHGVSSIFYLLESIFGLVLILQREQ